MVANIKVFLKDDELPKQWYNVLPDLPKPLPPPIDPQTREPVDPKKLERIFCKECVRQEVSSERWIPIPEELREIYLMWRPTPLVRARRLEEYLKTPARIYYKWEGVSPPGSHKPNTAVAQAYFAAKQGIKRLTTETGAGQWGSALAFATNLVGLEAMIYMVRVSYYQKPYRRIMMETWGAKVVPSPSEYTEVGKKFLEQDPEHPGSLGIAISEAIWDALQRDDTRYSLGSVLNHVLMHQTIVGLEAKKQMELLDDYPDVVVGCVGGGSNYGGFMLPFYYDVVSKKAPKPVRFVAVEPTSCPTLTKGIYSYDYGDTGKLTPLVPMYTLGYNFVPPPIHAGGLRYHGDAPILCLLRKEGILDAAAYDQVSVFEAARLFARVEGFIVAPETAHAVKHVIEEALDAKRKNEERVIIFNNSGHGHFDLAAYDQFLQGKLEPYYYEEEKIKQSIERLRKEMPWLDEINKKYLGV